MGRAFKPLPVNPEQIRRLFPTEPLAVRENSDTGLAEVEVEGVDDATIVNALAPLQYDAAVEPVERTNDRTLRQQAQAALAANRTFISLPSPSNAQNAAQIKALTRQNNGLIRLLLGQLDGTD